MTNVGPDLYVSVDCQGLVDAVLENSTGKNFSLHGVGHWRRERVTVWEVFRQSFAHVRARIRHLGYGYPDTGTPANRRAASDGERPGFDGEGRRPWPIARGSTTPC